MAAAHGVASPDVDITIPEKVKLLIGLVIALGSPVPIYAILLVDSGLVRFDFLGLLGVAASSALTAYGWYLYASKKKE